MIVFCGVDTNLQRKPLTKISKSKRVRKLELEIEREKEWVKRNFPLETNKYLSYIFAVSFLATSLSLHLFFFYFRIFFHYHFLCSHLFVRYCNQSILVHVVNHFYIHSVFNYFYDSLWFSSLIWTAIQSFALCIYARIVHTKYDLFVYIWSNQIYRNWNKETSRTNAIENCRKY